MSFSKTTPTRSWASVARGRPAQTHAPPVAPRQASSSTEHSSPDSLDTLPSSDGEGSVRSIQWPSDIQDAVLICIDLECHCRNQSNADFARGIKRAERRVCEIGIASFDCRTMGMADVGDRAHKSWPRIKSENLAIIEHEHVVGAKHPPWCKVGSADDFDFGTTRWVSKALIKDEFVKEVKRMIGEDPTTASAVSAQPYVNRRPIVWVTFAGGNDLKWLPETGIKLKDEFPNSSFRDIQFAGPRLLGSRIAEYLRKQQISASDLFNMLRFNVKGQHNGGNDATWELRAYLAECALTPEQDEEVFMHTLPWLD